MNLRVGLAILVGAAIVIAAGYLLTANSDSGSSAGQVEAAATSTPAPATAVPAATAVPPTAVPAPAPTAVQQQAPPAQPPCQQASIAEIAAAMSQIQSRIGTGTPAQLVAARSALALLDRNGDGVADAGVCRDILLQVTQLLR